MSIEFWETYFVFLLGFIILPFGFPDNFRFVLLSLLSQNVDIAFGFQWLSIAYPPFLKDYVSHLGHCLVPPAPQ